MWSFSLLSATWLSACLLCSRLPRQLTSDRTTCSFLPYLPPLGSDQDLHFACSGVFPFKLLIKLSLSSKKKHCLNKMLVMHLVHSVAIFSASVSRTNIWGCQTVTLFPTSERDTVATRSHPGESSPALGYCAPFAELRKLPCRVTLVCSCVAYSFPTDNTDGVSDFS